MTAFLWGHILGLLVAFPAGWWACARYATREREPARPAGQFSIQVCGALDVAGTELDPNIVVHRTEAR